MTSQLILVMGVAAALSAAQAAPPADLSTMVTKARLDGQLTSWCRGQFRAGRPNAYAAAVSVAGGGGRYLVLDGDLPVLELAPFKDTPELACYTPAQARTLNETIRISETVSGRVAPAFATTVVCAFIDNTSAVCWQYSPKTRAFVEVGGWQT